MGDVLSQSEVERLLQQVQEEETNTVVLQSNGRRSNQSRDSISAYDFRTPVFLSPIELRKLRIHHEEFIQSLAARLSIYLRVEFNLQMSQLHTISFRQWCESLDSPTHLSLFRVEPLRGICILDIPPRLGLTIVDRLLGGPGHSVTSNRELSELEVTLLDQVVLLMLTEWCTHWAKYRDLRPALFGHESNGLFLQAVDADAQAGGVQPGPAEGEGPVDRRRAGHGIGVESHQGQGAVQERRAHHQQVQVAAGAGAGAGDNPGRPEQRQQGGQQRVEGHQPGRLREEQVHGDRGECPGELVAREARDWIRLLGRLLTKQA